VTTQTIHIQTYDYGASLSSATLRVVSTDVLVATADSVNEVTADSGLYAAVFGETAVIAAGEYRLRAIVSGKPINRYVTLAGTDGEIVEARNERLAVLDSSSVTAVQSGLATSAALTTVGNNVTSILEDTGTTLPAQISAIESGASLEDIISGVQSVSGGIIAAQDESAFYITIGDTWTQNIGALGNLTNKTLVFSIKSKLRDADTAAVVTIVEGTGLTRLNGAATTAGWGSITINNETTGDITLRLESDATSLLTSGTYIDAVKALEDGDDRTLRQRGRTVVSAGVIADIT
jgi:hypothetical protein